MSHVVVGHCPRCGAPIYTPQMWMGITPPPSEYSCDCFSSAGPVLTTTGTVAAPVNAEQGPLLGTAEDIYKLVAAQDALIQKLELALEKARSSLEDLQNDSVRNLRKAERQRRRGWAGV